MAKTRLYNEDSSATWTLHRIFRDLSVYFISNLPLLYTSSVYYLYEKSSVEVDVFPESPITETQSWTEKTDDLVEFNSVVWKAKKDAGLSLAAPISGHNVPDSLKDIENALVSMHKLED